MKSPGRTHQTHLARSIRLTWPRPSLSRLSHSLGHICCNHLATPILLTWPDPLGSPGHTHCSHSCHTLPLAYLLHSPGSTHLTHLARSIRLTWPHPLLSRLSHSSPCISVTLTWPHPLLTRCYSHHSTLVTLTRAQLLHFPGHNSCYTHLTTDIVTLLQ